MNSTFALNIISHGLVFLVFHMLEYLLLYYCIIIIIIIIIISVIINDKARSGQIQVTLTNKGSSR